METIENTSEQKGVLTLGIVTDMLQLSKLQIRTLFTTILGRANPPGETEPLDDEAKLFLLVADLLEKLGFLKAEQRTLILTELKMRSAADECLPCLNQLAFADNRYCTWTGRAGWLDLETGEVTETLPHPPIETIGYNLNELVRRATYCIEARSGMHVKRPHAETVEES
jgi:hypothetical protein